MIVCKFGGTSVGDPVAIGRLVGIVRARAAESPLLVVSALAGTTNALVRARDHARAGRAAAALSECEAILTRHRVVALQLGLTDAVEATLAEGWTALRRALGGGALDSAGEDAVLGLGELWSSRLVTAALTAQGLPAVWCDARRVIRTDAGFGHARPDEAAINALARSELAPLLAAGRIPVIQGFIGATEDGRPTTLGRGGSDYSAALLGAALSATRVEIWTDVDGIMTADPRIVPEARLLPVTSHLEAAEMAAFGAKVLHPATQAPLVAARIPCLVLNSFAPERPGTEVLSGVRPPPIGNSPVRSVSCKRHVTVLNVRAPAVLGSTGFLRRLFEVFERLGVSVDVIATSEVNVSVTIDAEDRIAALREALSGLGDVSVYPDRAIIAVIGIGLRGTRGLAGRIFSAVQGVNVEVISQGASEINVTFVVRDAEAEAAVRTLHRVFIEPEPVGS